MQIFLGRGASWRARGGWVLSRGGASFGKELVLASLGWVGEMTPGAAGVLGKGRVLARLGWAGVINSLQLTGWSGHAILALCVHGLTVALCSSGCRLPSLLWS